MTNKYGPKTIGKKSRNSGELKSMGIFRSFKETSVDPWMLDEPALPKIFRYPYSQLQRRALDKELSNLSLVTSNQFSQACRNQRLWKDMRSFFSLNAFAKSLYSSFAMPSKL